MSASKYPIQRWDAYINGYVTKKVPIIYIKPDTAFMNFCRVNNNAIYAKVSGTGLPYDSFTIKGVVKKSCNVPNYRPNYFEKTGYYVIVLDFGWYGWPSPKSLGTVEFYGLDEPKAVEDLSLKTRTKPTVATDHKELGLSSWKIALLCLAILVILILLCTVAMKTRKY